MKRIVRLTESDLTRIVRRVIMEQAPETYKLSNIKLEVMKTDLGLMNWDAAMKACAALGDGWRLPNIEELEYIYEQKVEMHQKDKY